MVRQTWTQAGVSSYYKRRGLERALTPFSKEVQVRRIPRGELGHEDLPVFGAVAELRQNKHSATLPKF